MAVRQSDFLYTPKPRTAIGPIFAGNVMQAVDAQLGHLQTPNNEPTPVRPLAFGLLHGP